MAARAETTQEETRRGVVRFAHAHCSESLLEVTCDSAELLLEQNGGGGG